VKIAPIDLVGSFLKSAAANGIAVLVAYGDTEESPEGIRKMLRMVSNRPKHETDAFLGRLGAVDSRAIEQVAKELHGAEKGCDLCTVSEALSATSVMTARVNSLEKSWESLSDIAKRRHLTHVQEIVDLTRLLSGPANPIIGA